MLRWTTEAKAKLLGAKGVEGQAKLEECIKRLQIMETGIKLQRLWLFRTGDPAKAYAELNSTWRVLESFAASSPEQPLCCQFCVASPVRAAVEPSAGGQG